MPVTYDKHLCLCHDPAHAYIYSSRSATVSQRLHVVLFGIKMETLLFSVRNNENIDTTLSLGLMIRGSAVWSTGIFHRIYFGCTIQEKVEKIYSCFGVLVSRIWVTGLWRSKLWLVILLLKKNIAARNVEDNLSSSLSQTFMSTCS